MGEEGGDVLELVGAEESRAGPGQIRIAVRPAGVDPVDWRTRESRMRKGDPTTSATPRGGTALRTVDQVGVQPGQTLLVSGASVEGWVERVHRLGHVDAAPDLAGSGVVRELVGLTETRAGSSPSAT